MFRPAEGALGVDDPVVAEQESEPGGKGPLCCEWCEGAVELQCACMEGALESGDELAAEHAAEHLDGERKKERREEIKREWSGARPPAAASTQWTWG